MANCDICFREIPPASGKIISKEEFYIMIGIGYSPPLELLDQYQRFTGGAPTLSAWKEAAYLVSKSNWHLCEACAKYAERFRPQEFERFVGRYAMPQGAFVRSGASIALSPDGSTAFSLGPTQATLIDIDTASPLIRWKLDLADVTNGFAAFSADSRRLIYPETCYGMAVWAGPNWTAAPEGRLAGSFFSGQGNDLGRPQFSHDGGQIALQHLDGTVSVWDTRSRRKLWRSRRGVFGKVAFNTNPIAGVSWSPEGQVLASAGAREVIWWHAASGEKLREWQLGGDPDDYISALAWSTDGTRIIVGTNSGVIITVSADTAREKQRTETARIIALNRGGEFALGQWGADNADGYYSYHLGLWDVANETWIAIYNWPWEWGAFDSSISDDGKTLLLGGSDGQLRAIRVES